MDGKIVTQTQQDGCVLCICFIDEARTNREIDRFEQRWESVLVVSGVDENGENDKKAGERRTTDITNNQKISNLIYKKIHIVRTSHVNRNVRTSSPRDSLLPGSDQKG